jgi:oxalate decarboxylase/phosphoglucose isomerase-like protein (cupin superfamily)
MKQVKIENLAKNQISGITVMLPEDGTTYKENFFEWSASVLTSVFNTNEVTGGILKAWHHTPTFNEIETHVDKEMFYFISGTAIMLFVDVAGGKPVMASVQMARILPGTQIIIDAGKGHFVAVAEGSEPICAVVVAPKMDAPRMPLSEMVSGV